MSYNKDSTTDPDIVLDHNSVLLENQPLRLQDPSPFIQEDPVVIDTSHIKRDALEKRHKAAYAIGHFSNDLCAAGWFFFFTFYLKYVIKMDGGTIGLVMLAGQIADGTSTLIVGLISDKCKTPLGIRTPWYIIGTIITLPCFLGIFISPLGVADPKYEPGQADPTITTGKIVYYIVMASLFNMGWACVLIANMSVVNSLTYSSQRRDELVASRNTFTFVANIAVLVTSLILFSIKTPGFTQEIQFRILGILVVSIGVFTNSTYLFVIKEPYLSKEAKRLQKEFKLNQTALYKAEEGEKERAKSMSMQVKSWTAWFKESQFYVYAIVYTMTRMAINVVMTVQSLYLIRVLDFKAERLDQTPLAVSITPLVSYLASLLFQLFVYKHMLSKLRNRYLPMLIAIIVTTAGSIPLFIIKPDTRFWVFVCSPFIQVGLAIMMNTSNSLISDVIGKDADSSAFVYGFYSFIEKIANGLAIERALKVYEDNEDGLRAIMGGLPIFCCLVAFLLTYLGKFLYSDKQAKLTISGQKNRPMAH